MTEFQLYENWNSGYSRVSSTQPVATRVVCYGKIAQGRPVENNDVRVYGVRDKTNNYFIAEQIENTTDGTFATFVPRKMSATFVRLIVLTLILVILGLLSGISFPTGYAGMMSASTYQIVIGLITILIGVVTFFFAKNNHKPGRKPLLISLAALLVVLGIFIITLQDAEAKIAQLWDGLLNVLVAHAPAEVAKPINLYAMMKYNLLVWDFMPTVIGEKYRMQELDFSRKDLNVFFFRLQEQNDTVAS